MKREKRETTKRRKERRAHYACVGGASGVRHFVFCYLFFVYLCTNEGSHVHIYTSIGYFHRWAVSKPTWRRQVITNICFYFLLPSFLPSFLLPSSSGGRSQSNGGGRPGTRNTGDDAVKRKHRTGAMAVGGGRGGRGCDRYTPAPPPVHAGAEGEGSERRGVVTATAGKNRGGESGEGTYVHPLYMYIHAYTPHIHHITRLNTLNTLYIRLTTTY